MNPQQKKYVLKVEKGDELSLRHLAKISPREAVMRPAYEQAVRALIRILRDTAGFHKDYEELSGDPYEVNDLMFWYSGNVIAFNASRGGGKTVSMRSFAQILRRGFVEREGSRRGYTREYKVDNSFLEPADQAWLERCQFIPLTALEPALLEKEQNILYVVFSRLQKYAERMLENSKGVDRYEETQRNELIRTVHKVLSGINGIKRPGQGALEDLSALEDISDGLALRQHFHNLIQKILKLSAPTKDSSERYLVLLLDDADFKTEKAYEVLEDVRKYLMIPNLVILMSVDKDCLHDVVLQNNMALFPNLINFRQNTLLDDLSKVTAKYIAKLIPPTHMIVLPRMDECVRRYGDELDLHYHDETGASVLPWKQGDDWDLQTTILMMVYRKTGVLFVKPRTYMHNLIPRMLRDIVQLISFLDEMREIPVLDVKHYQSVKEYCEALLDQAEVAEENLQLFTKYIRTTWLDARIINYEDRKFLKLFEETARSNRVRLAYQHLVKKYAPEYDKEKYVYSRAALDELMWDIERLHRTEEDFILMFAIRTLFSLKSHQEILKIKRETALNYLKRMGQPDAVVYPLLVFDFDPEIVHVPRDPQIYDAAAAWIQEVYKLDDVGAAGILGAEQLDEDELEVLADVTGSEWLYSVVDEYPEDIFEFNVLNTITMALCLGRFDCAYQEGRGSVMEQQYTAYRVQEVALALFANSDVQMAVRKWLDEYIDLNFHSDAEPDPFEIWNQLGIGLSNLMRDIDRAKLQTCRPELTGKIWETDSYHILNGLLARISETRAVLDQLQKSAEATGKVTVPKGSAEKSEPPVAEPAAPNVQAVPPTGSFDDPDLPAID